MAYQRPLKHTEQAAAYRVWRLRELPSVATSYTPTDVEFDSEQCIACFTSD